jgi:uncharacterized RDD family membrane protein YckC
VSDPALAASSVDREEPGDDRREARLARIRQLQGTRAGFVSRVMANAIDWSMAILIEVLVYLLVSVIIYLFTRDVGFPQPSKPLLLVGFGVIVVLYLTSGWAGGATFGKQILGLRVTRLDGSVLGPRIAFVRAVTCFVFLPGILWVLFSARNRSLQDLFVRSEVVYDWKYRSPAS